MKSFASTLLLAGASATFAAIDFGIEGSISFVNMSSAHATRAAYGTITDSGAIITDESKATYTL